eukprot:2240576-Rhodomonas_salina.1
MRNPVTRTKLTNDKKLDDETYYQAIPNNPPPDHDNTHTDVHAYDACTCADPNCMLNSISNDQMMKHFGEETERKTQLYSHANQITSDIAPEKPNELLLVADSGANRHFIPEERHQ